MTPYEKAQKEYEKAREALNNIAHSLDASDEQIEAAKKAREKLTDEYIDKQVIKIDELTGKYTEFIKDMKKAIEKIGKESPLAALNTLQKIIDAGADVLKPTQDD